MTPTNLPPDPSKEIEISKWFMDAITDQFSNDAVANPTPGSTWVGYLKGAKAAYQILCGLSGPTYYEKFTALDALVNSPEIDDFLKGVQLEAAHQTERWSLEAEENKMPHHYACVMAKLTGKLAIAIFDGDTEKYKHHLITLAAVCFNVHRQIEKQGTLINKYFNTNEPK